ncbi:cupin domain-containing protein [Candidatus Nitrosocosmicus sp. R]
MSTQKNKFYDCKIMILVANNSNKPSKNNTFNINNENAFPKCDLNGIIFKTIISGEKTRGEYSMLEIQFPEGEVENEIPLHIQSKEIVIVYVIKGNFKIRYGQQDIVGSEGTVLKLEKGISRSFQKKGNLNGKLLVIYIPAGFENFFKDITSSNIDDFTNDGIEDPILIQLLEKNYGARVQFDEP